MNNIKKIFGLGLIGIALAMSVPASAKITANRLAANRLAANRLSSNSSKLAGNGAFNDVSEVVLADGTRLTR
jgi:hypothetical protein